jgi:hypothetical protein
MIRNDTKWYKMIQNDTKWYKMIQNDTKWYKMIQNDTSYFLLFGSYFIVVVFNGGHLPPFPKNFWVLLDKTKSENAILLNSSYFTTIRADAGYIKIKANLSPVELDWGLAKQMIE